jgi:hypothetical protein
MAEPSNGSRTSISLSARLLCSIGPPTVILATSYADTRTGLLSPIAFAPTALAYAKWRQENARDPSRRAEFEPLAWTYAFTATVGVAAVSALQMGVGYGLSTLFYGTGETRSYFLQEIMRSSVADLSVEDIKLRAEIASSWRYTIFTTLCCFGAAGLGEEALKYLPVVYASRRGTPEQRKPRNRTYLDYALASSLGFGLVEGIGFLYSSCVHGEEKGGKLALTIFERFIMGSSGHVLMAVLSALRATRRDYYGGRQVSWLRIIGPSVLIHGAWDLGALLFSASDGNVGWVHPTSPPKVLAMLGVACSMWAGTAFMVWNEYKTITELDKKKE